MLTISSISVSPLPQQPASVTAQPISSAPASRAGGGASARPNAGVAVPVAPAGEGVAVQRAFVPTSLPPVEATRPTAAADLPTNAVRPEIPVAATPTALAAARAASAQPAATELAAAAASVRSSRANPAPVAEGARADRTEPGPEGGAGVGNLAGNASVGAGGAPVRAGEADAAGAPVNPGAGGGQVVLPTVNLGTAQPASAAAPDNPPEPPPNPADVALEQRINNLLPSLWEASRAAVDVLIGDEARASAARAADAAALALAPINLPAAQAASASPRRAETAGPAQNYAAQSGAAGRTGPGSVVDTSA